MYVKCCPSQTLWEGFRIGLASFMVVGFWTTNSPHYTTFCISLHVYVHLLLTIKYLQLFKSMQLERFSAQGYGFLPIQRACSGTIFLSIFSRSILVSDWYLSSYHWNLLTTFGRFSLFLLDKWQTLISSRYLTGKTEALTKSILHCPVKTMQNAAFPEVQRLERTAKQGHKISASNFIS